MSKYKYPENVDYLSGFGANTSYELGCQAMVIAGMEWFDVNPDALPHVEELPNLFGITKEGNIEAEQLSAAMLSAVEGASWAMHHQAMLHVFAARRLGWEEYLNQLEKSDE